MSQNVGSYDRVIRIVLAAALASVLLEQNLSGPVLLAWLVVPLVLLLTGVFAYCPLYGLLGISTHRPFPR
ncbi:DUF2892 domain-containing protein [Hymenobacter koreensis]|uniref:Inner membrane protein YgaP-like transmembrane domain-containing protein n=1 Tax=Hymenobacter koreensis TaxID=1084523 RepID=A0ABP8J6W2_9BACT